MLKFAFARRSLGAGLAAFALATIGAAQTILHRSFAESEDGLYSARSGFIEVRGDVPPVMRLAASESLALAKREIDGFVKLARQSAGRLGRSPSAPWTFDATTTVSHHDANLVSWRFEGERYTGGAHSNAFSTCANFGMVSGKAVRLRLKDILASSDLRRDLARLVAPKLLEQRRSREGQAQRPVLGEELETGWNIDAEGMTWTFESGVVGSQAEGRYVVRVSWAELAPMVRASSPVASLAFAFADDLLGEWRLVRFVSMDGTVVTIDKPWLYTFTLDREGSFRARVDVNRVQGTFTVQSPRITFSPKTSTSAAPPPGSFHDAFLRHLKAVRSYTIRDGELSLALAMDGGILTFRRP